MSTRIALPELAPRSARPDPWTPRNRQLAEQLVVHAHKPARFALVAAITDYHGDVHDIVVIAHGIDTGESAWAIVPPNAYHESITWYASTAKALVRRFCAPYDIRLHWLDPEPVREPPQI